MIITFHLAVSFAYYVWENYISGLFSNANSSDNNSNDTDASSSHLATEPRHGCDNVINENGPNPASRARIEIGMIREDAAQVTKSEKDLSESCAMTCEEDEGRNVIYNVKPKFECCFDSVERGIRFIPPVFVQRYMVINEILKDPSWSESIKKVVDFGCAEMCFESRYLKKLFGIQEIVAVDIDLELLERNVCKTSPSPVDYLDPRPTPLTFSVFCGSVAHTNEALAAADAVIAIELIEHLYPGDLDGLPFTVFGFIKPKIAIFTTPNADFNVLFPNFSGFRHDDHKFEWSQQQFQDWGNNLALRYPEYTVTFQGVGPGPAGTEHLGCCSQMATFVKMFSAPATTEDELHSQDGEYILLRESAFPYFVDKRTQEEKIRDDAFCFISRWIAINRQFDEEERRKEISLKLIMERVKCYNREKLKNVLRQSNWEVTTNEDGYEVVLLPDSEDEDEDSSTDGIERDEDEDFHCDDTLTQEENWDGDENESDVPVHNDAGACCLCLPLSEPASNSSVLGVDAGSVCGTRIGSSECNDSVVNFTSDECSLKVAVSPDDSFVLDRFNNSQTDCFSEECCPEKDLNLDLSVYETPYTNTCRTVDYESKLSNTCAQSLDHDETGCKKALSFESSGCDGCGTPNVFSDSDIPTESVKNDSFCCSNSLISPFDTSIYATPCCSQLHKTNIPKCLSLQQINAHCSPPISADLDCSAKGYLLNGEKNDKFSKSMEGLKCQESCDTHETCSIASRIVDSGYPDSCSEQNMDMDLTLEQFEDIESDGNISSRSPSPPPPPVPRVVENVENGDVVNNNRDGEGNNLIADMDVEPLAFEAQIHEVNNEVPNLAADVEDDLRQFEARFEEDNDGILNLAAVNQLHQLLCKESMLPDSNNDSLDTTSYVPSLELRQADKLSSSTLSSRSNTSLGLENKTMTENPSTVFSTIVEKPEVQTKRSDSSIVTSSSWDHLDSTRSQSCLDTQEEESKFDDISNGCNLKSHNSLTTVLDGCSKFSNCSLVCSTDKDNTDRDQTEETQAFPEWLLYIDESLFNEGIDSLQLSRQKDQLSLRSVYQSAESMSSLMFESSLSFPRWLLDLDVSDVGQIEVAGRISAASVWDSDSFEEALNYDVPVDVRGGGDPLRNTWH